MTAPASKASVPPGHSERVGDDGCVLWCPTCGAEAKRTRSNPYPAVPHRSKP
jgi:hypothetical protein